MDVEQAVSHAWPYRVQFKMQGNKIQEKQSKGKQGKQGLQKTARRAAKIFHKQVLIELGNFKD